MTPDFTKNRAALPSVSSHALLDFSTLTLKPNHEIGPSLCPQLIY